MPRSPKSLEKYVPGLKENGIKDLVAAAKPGVGFQTKQITQAGASPFSVVFADLAMDDMADATYTVNVGGETAGAPKVDQGTITPEGFDIVGGADTEVLHVLVAGTLRGQAV